MAILADRKNYPVYIHCMVGSDRTGTLFAVLDGVLGREDKYIYDDYELPSMNEWLPRFRYGRKSAELFGYLDPNAPKWKEIHEEVGSCKLYCKTLRENAEKYLLDLGVPKAHIDAFREIMFEEDEGYDDDDDDGEIGRDAAAVAAAALEAAAKDAAAAKAKDNQ